MSDSPLLKFHRITNLTDARLAAAAGAEWIGFPFHPDDHSALSPITARDMAGWLSGSKILGELGPQTVDESTGLIGLVPLQAVEWAAEDLLRFPFLPSVEILARIQPQRYTAAQLEVIMEELTPAVSYFVVEADDAKALLEQASVLRKFPIIWQAGFSPDTLSFIKDTFNPAGFSISGNIEHKPGLSDTELLNEQLEWLLGSK